MANVVEVYLKLCSQKRVEPYYGFISHVDEGAIDSDVDFVSPSAWNLFTLAMKTCDHANLSYLRLGRLMGRTAQHPPKNSQQLVSFRKLAQEYPFTEFNDAMSVRGADGVAQCCRTSALLKSIQICNLPFGAKGGMKLAQSLFVCTQLQQLILDGSLIGDQGLEHLTKCLLQMQHLEFLSLKACDLTDKSSRNLSAIIKTNRGRESTESWAKTLRSSSGSKATTVQTYDCTSTLKKLNLEANFLGDVVVEEIFTNALLYDRSLTSLNLARNVVSSGGAKAIIHALSRNTSLQFLDLSDNPGVISFCGALESEGYYRVIRDALPSCSGCLIVAMPRATPATQQAMPIPQNTCWNEGLPQKAEREQFVPHPSSFYQDPNAVPPHMTPSAMMMPPNTWAYNFPAAGQKQVPFVLVPATSLYPNGFLPQQQPVQSIPQPNVGATTTHCRNVDEMVKQSVEEDQKNSQLMKPLSLQELEEAKQEKEEGPPHDVEEEKLLVELANQDRKDELQQKIEGMYHDDDAPGVKKKGDKKFSPRHYNEEARRQKEFDELKSYIYSVVQTYDDHVNLTKESCQQQLSQQQGQLLSVSEKVEDIMSDKEQMQEMLQHYQQLLELQRREAEDKHERMIARKQSEQEDKEAEQELRKLLLQSVQSMQTHVQRTQDFRQERAEKLEASVVGLQSTEDFASEVGMQLEELKW